MKLLLLLTLLLTVSLSAKDLDFTRELNLDADGLKKFSIDCGAGSLDVKGTSGKDIKVDVEIIIEGVNDRKAEQILEESLKLSLEKSGSRAELICKFDNLSWTHALRGISIRADIIVDMPAGLALEVEDGSGSIEISGIENDVQIDDGSGSIFVEDIDGGLEIEDNSGNVTVRKITGNIFIEDGSGDMDIEDVKGNVKIDDGSGSITVNRVTEDVKIKEDGSGGVSVRNIEGRVYRDDD